ncbi:MAG: alpha-hydroxy-acid oxidizing protein [Betaproteobacteria bacterium]|nr:alpha-hydroxy-acid oxidizing protein [Betaproteobacteria bacterium]
MARQKKTSKQGKRATGTGQMKDLERKSEREGLANDMLTLQEIALAARRNLSQMLWDTLCGGSDSETTLRRNRLALDSLALRQRVLVNVADIDMTTTLLGQKLSLPVFIAPVGNFLQLADPQGAIAVARAAIARGTTAFISTAAKPSLEAVAEAAGEPLLFQLYVRSDRAWVKGILSRAKAAGYRAICVTVDRAYYSRRERDVINRFLMRESAGDPRHQASLNWEDIVWMKQHTGLPMILKGIATAEDACLAVEHGADVIYVSNHGGRQLDHAQASIEVLPEVVAAVDGRAEVLVDGGILRGTDVIKAIALGARAVGVGKLQGLALAAAGEAGISKWSTSAFPITAASCWCRRAYSASENRGYSCSMIAARRGSSLSSLTTTIPPLFRHPLPGPLPLKREREKVPSPRLRGEG